jgi:UDP-GlcNAc3NAcA epimerase
MKKIAIVVGARPQFIKLSPLIEVLTGKVNLVLVHTGQHYDFEMSDIFFNQLNLPSPDYHLGVGSANQAAQTGAMMGKFEEILVKELPDMVIVTGDTNSTLAGALAAAKNAIPLAHIEAGLRSKSKWLPEQINRIVADRLSDILCAPTKASINHLEKEGIRDGVFLTGDLLYDLIDKINPTKEITAGILSQNHLLENEYIFLTVHRSENVDEPSFLENLIDSLKTVQTKIFFPIHPRTLKNFQKYGLYSKLTGLTNIQLSKPVGIIESLALTKSALGVITDSGGLQREAAYFGKKTFLLRDETEWLELESCGAVTCIGRSLNQIDFYNKSYSSPYPDYFKMASAEIADAILQCKYFS